MTTIPWLTTNLLHEARHLLMLALADEIPCPVQMKGPCAVTTLAADDKPVDALQVDGAEVFEKRFRRYKPYSHIGRLQVGDARDAVLLVLDRYPPPDVRSLCGKAELRVEQVAHPLRPLGQHLIRVPVGFHHDFGYANNVVVINVLEKQVGHGVDKDFARVLPTQRFFQLLRHEAQVKPLFKRVPRYTPETFCESASVAVLAAGANLVATPRGIPRGVRPFNFACDAHFFLHHSVG